MLCYREVKIFKQIKWFWEWNNFGKALPNNNKDIQHGKPELIPVFMASIPYNPNLQAMFGSRKLLRKEKKNVKENDFLICGLHNRKYKRKPNIIKILKKKRYIF